MFRDTDAVSTLAVKDLEGARKFYADTLGLPQVGAEGDEVITFQSGHTKVNVYRSEHAGTNKATALSWVVSDVGAAVKQLKQKGVAFEHYDMPGGEREGDVHVFGDLRTAWFKDPDGNILNVVNR